MAKQGDGAQEASSGLWIPFQGKLMLKVSHHFSKKVASSAAGNVRLWWSCRDLITVGLKCLLGKIKVTHQSPFKKGTRSLFKCSDLLNSIFMSSLQKSVQVALALAFKLAL